MWFRWLLVPLQILTTDCSPVELICVANIIKPLVTDRLPELSICVV